MSFRVVQQRADFVHVVVEHTKRRVTPHTQNAAKLPCYVIVVCTQTRVVAPAHLTGVVTLIQCL